MLLFVNSNSAEQQTTLPQLAVDAKMVIHLIHQDELAM
jgi:hypothetical protein